MAVAEQESTLRIIAEHKHRAGLLTPVLKEARKVGRLIAAATKVAPIATYIGQF